MSGGPTAGMALAAGLGTRMRPLTDDRPKALLPVAGRALLDRALDALAAGGVERAVVNAHHFADQIVAHLAARAAAGAPPAVTLSDERDALLETGGGVARALPLLGPDPFFTINADAVWTGPAPCARLAAAWPAVAAEADALLLLVRRADAVGYTRAGDFDLAEAAPVTAATPTRRRGETADYVFTGAQILRPEAMAGCPAGAFSMNRVWDRLLAAGRLRAVVHRGGWVDVGTPAGIAAAEAALAAAA